ncbi:MAG: peptidoglycan-associated lipoprotein Pal [Magnetovibrio sp.]|nr:peptidoglycan-associated lipoprotein Pal [Magnetovibrio sp.]
MRFKIVSLIAVVSLVAACSSKPTAETATTSGAGAATAPAHAAVAKVMTSQEQLNKIGDRVLFGFDQYNLTSGARGDLKKQAAWLAANGGVRVTVEGHADERGTREYNLALGERRANSVKDYLMTLGVSSDRINTISYGKERPAIAASNEAAWRANRRGVTVVR